MNAFRLIIHNNYLPIINFHVLPVEKENCWGDVADVKVSGVNRSFVDINYVDGRHVTQVVGSFWQLNEDREEKLAQRKTGPNLDKFVKKLLTISSNCRQTESSSLPKRRTTTFSATPLITSSTWFLDVNLGKNRLIFRG